MWCELSNQRYVDCRGRISGSRREIDKEVGTESGGKNDQVFIGSRTSPVFLSRFPGLTDFSSAERRQRIEKIKVVWKLTQSSTQNKVALKQEPTTKMYRSLSRMDVLLHPVRCKINASAHHEESPLGKWSTKAKDMNLSVTTNPVDFNSSPVIVNEDSNDCSPALSKPWLSIELVIEFLLIGPPAQKVELCNRFREMGMQPHHGSMNFIGRSPAMGVDAEGNTSSEVGSSWKSFRASSPSVVATCHNSRWHWFNQQPISICKVKLLSRASLIVVVSYAECTVECGDHGVSVKCLGHDVGSHPDFGLQLLEYNKSIIAVIA